jgi:hypothetical protein
LEKQANETSLTLLLTDQWYLLSSCLPKKKKKRKPVNNKALAVMHLLGH